MKRLTIGSLKYDNIIDSTISIDQTIHEEKPPIHKMKKMIEIEQNQQSFRLEVNRGQSILDAALKEGIPIQYKCKKGTCGKCKVKVLKGHLSLKPANQLEEMKLKQDMNSSLRLACQAIVK